MTRSTRKAAASSTDFTARDASNDSTTSSKASGKNKIGRTKRQKVLPIQKIADVNAKKAAEILEQQQQDK